MHKICSQNETLIVPKHLNFLLSLVMICGQFLAIHYKWDALPTQHMDINVC